VPIIENDDDKRAVESLLDRFGDRFSGAQFFAHSFKDKRFQESTAIPIPKIPSAMPGDGVESSTMSPAGVKSMWPKIKTDQPR